VKASAPVMATNGSAKKEAMVVDNQEVPCETSTV
jgi:hypothetical protein